MPRGQMKQQKWVDIAVKEVKRETEKAICVALAAGGDDVWLPKSQLKEPDEISQGDTDITVTVTEWIAQQKDLPTDFTLDG